MLRRNVKRFGGGLVFKAQRLVYHSTLGLRVIKKREKVEGLERGVTTRWRYGYWMFRARLFICAQADMSECV